MRSYVSADKRTTFCIYDAPTPEAIRKTSARNELPVDQIIQVRVLDPYSVTALASAGAQRRRTSIHDAIATAPQALAGSFWACGAESC